MYPRCPAPIPVARTKDSTSRKFRIHNISFLDVAGAVALRLMHKHVPLLARWTALTVLAFGFQVCSKAQTVQFTDAVSLFDSNAYSPTGVATDASGNIFIADTYYNRILKVPTTGLRSAQSVVNYTLDGPQGIAVDAGGSLYISDTGHNRVVKETPSGSGYTESAIASGLDHPEGIAVDGAGNVYIAEVGNNRILKETPSSGSYVQTTILSNLSYSVGLASDPAGNLYIADENNNRILKETLSNGSYVQSIVASGLNAPLGVAVDSYGNVFVADTWNSRVVEETLSGGSYAQAVIATGLSSPQGVAVSASGKIYVTQSASYGVDEVQLGTVDMSTVQTGHASGRMTLTFNFSSAGSIGSPLVVTQGVSGLDFTDAGNGSCTANGASHSYSAGDTCTVNVIFKPRSSGARYGAVLLYDDKGNPISTTYLQGISFGPQPIFPPGIQSTVIDTGPANLYQIAMDGSGALYLVDATHNQVLKETPFAGGYSQSMVPLPGFNNPEGLAVDGAGDIYVSDTFNNLVMKFTPTPNGYLQSVIYPNGTRNPQALAVDEMGNLYIVDTSGNRVLKETPSNGGYTQSTVGGTQYYPTAVAVDSAGAVYIASQDPSVHSNIGNGWVVKESPSNGSYVQSTVASGFVLNTGLTVDGNGNVYIVDNEGGQGYTGVVYKETPTGSGYSQTTIGNNLKSPWDAVVDGSGNVYIVNRFGSGQVIKEDFSDAVAVRFAATAVGQTSSDSPQTVTIENAGNAAMEVPVPTSGTNPLVPSGFVVNDSASSACPTVDTGSSAPGAIAANALCDLTISFSPQLSTDTSGWLTYTYSGPGESSSSYQTAAIPLIAGSARLNPTLTWNNPSSIVYGRALGGMQLNTSANEPGAFSYSPAAGTILSVGSHTLSVSFTPSNTTDFNLGSDQVQINVTQGDAGDYLGGTGGDYVRNGAGGRATGCDFNGGGKLRLFASSRDGAGSGYADAQCYVHAD